MSETPEFKQPEQMSVHQAYQPEQLNDALARQTNWSPLIRGGSKFLTHRLVEIHPDRLEFQITSGVQLYLVLLTCGLLLFFGFFGLQLISGGFFGIQLLLFILIGLVFTGSAGLYCYFSTAPIVFDKAAGMFWKGRRKTPENVTSQTLKAYTDLEEIHAVQLLSEACVGSKTTFHSYELNLVLKDGQRINLIDHGDQALIQKEALLLSAFLAKPLWDGL